MSSALVLGICLTDRPNWADAVVRELEGARAHRVTQRWVALGEAPPSPTLAPVTARRISRMMPKYLLLNELLASEELDRYDFVLNVDDDIALPPGFLDRFLGLQERLGFALAQPARTANSFIDHPIVEQQRGAIARQTWFVEIGPVVSWARASWPLVFPFDLSSPMGWGYENVWAFCVAERGWKMGIIDATAVDHSLRPPVAHYDWSRADGERNRLWGRHEHLPLDDCYRVVEVWSE